MTDKKNKRAIVETNIPKSSSIKSVRAKKTEAKTTEFSNIKDLVVSENKNKSNELEQAVFKQINNQIQNLSPTDKKIMKDMVAGLTDVEIMNNYEVSIDYLTNLRSNPSFTHELQQLTLTNTLAFKDKQIAFLSRIAEKTYDALMVADLENISADRLVKMFTDLTKQMNEQTSGTKANLDITVQLKNQIGKERLETDEFGRVKIKPNYSAPAIDDEEYLADKPSNPVIDNDTGEIEKFEIDYEELERNALKDWQ